MSRSIRRVSIRRAPTRRPGRRRFDFSLLTSDFYNAPMMSARSCSVLVLVLAALTGPTPAAEQQTPAARVDFDREIRPLLSDRCFRCHGPDSAKRKAELRLDVRDGAFRKMDDGWAIVKPRDPAH